MSRKLITVAAGVGVAGALALGVCVAATSASAAGARPLVTFHDGKNHVVTGPSHLAPGLAGFHVTGPKHTLFQLAKVRKNAGKAALVAETAATNQGNVKGLEKDFKFFGGTSAHANDLYVDLTPGTYFALDVDAKKLTASMIQKVTVGGAQSDSAAPRTSGTITSVGDMKWAATPNHIPASGYLQFDNRSEKNKNNSHFINLVRLQNGKKYADVKKVFEGKESPQQVFASGPHNSFGTGVLSSGQTQVSTYSINPGRYMLACFFPDRYNGQPHAFMGMYRTILVG